MKFYQQEGSALKATNLNDSGNVCECCREFDHTATEYHTDDVECKQCGALCCCGCHRDS